MGIIAVIAFVAIGLGLIPWSATSGPPILSITASLEEPSKNGFLDAGETGRLRLSISNKGGTARNIRIDFDPAFITGISYKKPNIISKLEKDGTENVVVAMTASKHVRTRTQSLKILLVLVENNGTPLASEDFSLKIRGARRE